MIRVVASTAAALLLLAGCAGSNDDASDEAGQAPDAVETAAGGTGSGGEADGGADTGEIGPVEVCDLFEGLDVAGLISAAPGDRVSNDDDECTVPALDELLFAETTIRLGVAPALPVIRASYEGDAYQCDVVEVDDIGDGGFTCLGGRASSFVVFVAGEHLVLFSAGNSLNGAPQDDLMIESAHQVYANITR